MIQRRRLRTRPRPDLDLVLPLGRIVGNVRADMGWNDGLQIHEPVLHTSPCDFQHAKANSSGASANTASAFGMSSNSVISGRTQIPFRVYSMQPCSRRRQPLILEEDSSKRHFPPLIIQTQTDAIFLAVERGDMYRPHMRVTMRIQRKKTVANGTEIWSVRHDHRNVPKAATSSATLIRGIIMDRKSNSWVPSRYRLAVATVPIVFALIGGRAYADSAQHNADSAGLIYGSDSTTLSIDSGRPLMRAALILQALYGFVITYEDPLYTNSDAVIDIAPTTRKDYASYRPGTAPKLLVPKPWKLTMQIPKLSKPTSSDALKLLQDFIRLQNSASHGGHFHVVQTGDSFHIIPSELRDRAGNWLPPSTVLDTRISLPQVERSETDLYRAIVRAIKTSAHVSMDLSVGEMFARPTKSDVPTNIGANDETARNVLIEALAAHSIKRTWTLAYGTEDNTFELHILDIPTDVARVSY